ncbi:AsnC family transcriptional regulator [Actinacidiphila sp. ITFR-21]|uniref:AsnC family transcriptional regulator n=1 Tax=Actinacidiphila sp. ITFR-21 TaxID=3075199 RepID=UPI00288B5566|nr:AsnC family transcriptional regulator [Streptomyces sp. ITFR-21]WNI15634.1 AsnC family transcriptional regulator [Streptomyces sp. ITFR-21]
MGGRTAAGAAGGPPDGTDRRILAALADDARPPAAALAALTGRLQSTVRRRLARLAARQRLITQIVIDPHRLGLAVRQRQAARAPGPPGHGRPRAHRTPGRPRRLRHLGPGQPPRGRTGTGPGRPLRLPRGDLPGLGITHAETAIVSQAVQRPGPGR